MDFHANDPILQNNHHFYDMTREEKIELAYQKAARVITAGPEELTYKNIIYYTMVN